MISFKDHGDILEVWTITPPLPAVARRPEIAARIVLERRGAPVAFDLTREQVAQVIAEL